MPRMTKAQAGTLAKLQAAVEKARDSVYASAPRNDIPLSVCLSDHASALQVQTYRRAALQLADFESRMVSEGRAWRDSACRVQYY